MTEDDRKDGKPVNVFAEQLLISGMTRLYNVGYETVVLREQHRMVEGTALASSKLRYNVKTIYAPSTALSARPRAQQAIRFLKDKILLETKAPHICLSVSQGITIRGPTMSRKNLHNIIVDLMIVEEVVKLGIFTTKQITITTPYKDQASAIRTALTRAIKISDFWKNINAHDIKVATIDSMQGNENKLVIYDLVLSKKRTGGYGFVTEAGRLNVGVSCHEDMFVLVCDIDCLDEDEQLPDDDDDDALEVDASTGAKANHKKQWSSKLKELLSIYKNAAVVKTVADPSELSQAKFVDLKLANEYWKARRGS